jgi:hypothetical protein
MEFPLLGSGPVEPCTFTADFAIMIGQWLLPVYGMYENQINRIKNITEDGISCLGDAAP